MRLPVGASGFITRSVKHPACPKVPAVKNSITVISSCPPAAVWNVILWSLPAAPGLAPAIDASERSNLYVLPTSNVNWGWSTPSIL